jgi:hypothetical protein
MSRLLKIIVGSVGVWILVLGLTLIIPIPIISSLAFLLSLLVGFALLILALISLVTAKNKISSLLAIVLIIATTGLAITKAFDWGARIHFQLNRSRYEAKVAQVLSVKDEAERKKLCGDECWIMNNDSNRISFDYVRSILSTQAFVYDPTGGTEQGKQISPTLIATFVDAEHLSGNWYIVTLGD